MHRSRIENIESGGSSFLKHAIYLFKIRLDTGKKTAQSGRVIHNTTLHSGQLVAPRYMYLSVLLGVLHPKSYSASLNRAKRERKADCTTPYAASQEPLSIYLYSFTSNYSTWWPCLYNRRGIQLHQVFLHESLRQIEFFQRVHRCPVLFPGEPAVQNGIIDGFPGGKVLIHQADGCIGTKFFRYPAQHLARARNVFRHHQVANQQAAPRDALFINLQRPTWRYISRNVAWFDST